MNKEIYGHLSAGQRAADGALLDAQADLLKLVIPIINVMEIINNNSANLTSDGLCALKSMVMRSLFSGNENLALIKRRKEALKPCLPAGVQKLCQKPDVSGKLLFGDKLQQQMKELN